MLLRKKIGDKFRAADYNAMIDAINRLKSNGYIDIPITRLLGGSVYASSGSSGITQLSVYSGSETEITDNVLTTDIADMFAIKSVGATPIMCIKSTVYVTDGTYTGPLALKWDPATSKWGIDVPFFG